MMSEGRFAEEVSAELVQGLEALGLDVVRLKAPLLDYLGLLVRWNKAYNLTAIRDPLQMVRLHLLDSLVIAPYVSGGRLADLGTGAGLPGIPLALVYPQLQVSLVESNGKKARFLREVVRSLSLANVQVLQARAESVEAGDGYDVITARALDTLAGIIAVGGHLLKPDGRLLAMKGVLPEDECAALPDGWKVGQTHILSVPGVGAQRHLVVVSQG